MFVSIDSSDYNFNLWCNTGWSQSHAPMLTLLTIVNNVNIGSWLCGHPVYKKWYEMLKFDLKV